MRLANRTPSRTLSSSAASMPKLRVRTLNGETFRVAVDQDCTLEGLRCVVAETALTGSGVEPAQVQLSLNKRVSRAHALTLPRGASLNHPECVCVGWGIIDPLAIEDQAVTAPGAPTHCTGVNGRCL